MAECFRLPDLGEGIHEAEILTIAVAPDDEVVEGGPLLEVETDKAAVEIPSPYTGRIVAVLVSVGDTVQVGDALIEVATGQVEAGSAAPPATEQAQDFSSHKMPVPASPSTRRLARELGVDLHAVTPTGAKGLVTAEDVRNHRESPPTPPTKQPLKNKPQEEEEIQGQEILTSQLPDFSRWGTIERRPFRSIRRKTAQKMSASWAAIPHVNCQDLVDVTLLEEFRQKHKDEIKALDGRLTMTVFAMKAAATALKKYPEFNASLDIEANEIIIKKYFHIGVAVDTEHGLMVPVVRDVDRKSIKEISIELEQAISRARERSIDREDLVGGTFTITNAGAIGGSHFTAIINHPEIAILGMGQARLQPAVVTGDGGRAEIVPRLMMPVILCFDHRVADGGDAIRFLQVIINSLEDPEELLISMI